MFKKSKAKRFVLFLWIREQAGSRPTAGGPGADAIRSGCSVALWGWAAWGRTDRPIVIDLHAYQLNYFPLDQWQVLFPSGTGRSKSPRIQSATVTHNWVLNTMVRSWNATLAARPKASPRTMTKMKVMIQISCRKKATHTPTLQLTLMQVQCLRSIAMRKHKLLGTTAEVGSVQKQQPASRGHFCWLRFWTTETQADILKIQRESASIADPIPEWVK